MSHALSVAELDDQRVELLPARTALTLLGGLGLDATGGNGDDAGAGGDGGSGGSINVALLPVDIGGSQFISQGHGGAGGEGGSSHGGDGLDVGKH